MGARDQNGAVDEAIAATRAAFVAALARGDAKAAAGVYARDARLLPPSSALVQGREAIATFWQAGIDAGIYEVEAETLELERSERFASEIGLYALRLRAADGVTVIDRGKYLRIHARQADGQWRWAVEMFSPDTPPVTTKDGPSREAAARARARTAVPAISPTSGRRSQ